MRLTRDPTSAADAIAIVTMVIAILAIVWARIELYGTGDIEDALAGDYSAATLAACGPQHEAVLRNRMIVGFSQ
ncbi:MAG TPA: hypothetical protein VFX67_02085 [Burkholderiales bacterium]|nr:hypothetical protein [Burkholderiales bacterium]